MAYQNVSFSAGETLTATKMNQMAANDAAFHDGTGIAAGAITADKIDFTTFGENFGTAHSVTGGTVRMFRIGKVGFFSGESNSKTYTGTFTTIQVAIPSSLLPDGTRMLPVQATTIGHTIDDDQITHGVAGGVISGNNGKTFNFAILSSNATSKSCAVAFFFPVIFP